MPEIIGIDHIYITVSDLVRSEKFYDVVMTALGFRKNDFRINGERHVHHFCLRVESERDVKEAAAKLREAGVSVSEPKLYPEHAPDYFAVFFSDPDGIRLEITNYRMERRQRHDNWESVKA